MTVPQWIEPRKLAVKNAVFDGVLPGSNLTRLKQSTVKAGDFDVKVTFEINDSGIPVLLGRLIGHVTCRCERCLDTLELELSPDIELAIVKNEEQADKLPKRFEPWFVEEDKADLHSILEEELILALPLVVTHDHSCVDKSEMQFGDSDGASDASDSQNPFSVLEKLKNK